MPEFNEFPEIILEEYDIIEITGIGGDGVHYVDIVGTIATASNDGAIKIWPDDDIKIGKIWFMRKNIESVRIIEKAN
jgi:hypothetical protein